MFAPRLLAGRSIVVTGGGSGLGLAMAKTLASYGAKVTIAGRRAERLEGASREIAAAAREGGDVATFAADVREPAQCEALIAHAAASFGNVDGLVNNAAGNFLAATEDLSANAFNSVVQIVLYGTFHCTTELGRRLVARKQKGDVLAITTTYAATGSAFVIPSAAAKAGVRAIVKGLAVEWAAYGIRLNAIAPGPFPTEGAFSRLMASPEYQKQALARIPSRRFGEHWELTNLVAYLMSDASPYQTGDLVTLDGAEALFSGQQFAGLAHLDRAAAKEMMAALKPRK